MESAYLKVRFFAFLLVGVAMTILLQLDDILAKGKYWGWLFDSLPSLKCLVIDVLITAACIIFFCLAIITAIKGKSPRLQFFGVLIIIANIIALPIWWFAELDRFVDITTSSVVMMICMIANCSLMFLTLFKPDVE
jgi:hypothetical protein